MEVFEKLQDFLPLYQVDKRGRSKKIVVVNSDQRDQLPNAYTEGGIIEVTRELRKRDPSLRKDALEHYNNICFICEEDYTEIYGDLGISFLEVHHKIPVSDGIRKNSIDDVCLVCANCHRMIHSIGKDGILINELREIIRENRAKSET